MAAWVGDAPKTVQGAAYLLVIFHVLVFLLPIVVPLLHAVEDDDVTQHCRLKEQAGMCQPRGARSQGRDGGGGDGGGRETSPED